MNVVTVEVMKFVTVDREGNEAEPTWGFHIWDDYSCNYADGWLSASDVYTVVLSSRQDLFDIIQNQLHRANDNDESYCDTIREHGGFVLNGNLVNI